MSTKLQERLNNRLHALKALDTDVAHLLRTAESDHRFDSSQELRDYLSEGALLNVTRLASDCLSIPSGNYVVWLTNSGRTVLVPTGERQPSREVHPKVEDKYTLHTAKLLGIWNKLERTLAESRLLVREAGPSERPENWRSGNETQDVGGHFDRAPEQMPENPYTFGSHVSRTALWQAMQRAKLGVSELADAVGVDKSTVSRLLRDVEEGPGDPHGRNPSVALAQKIAQILGVDVDEVLPPPDDVYTSHRQATSGSGRGGAGSLGGKGGAGFTAGAGGMEDKIREIAGLMVECRVDPVQFLAESLIGDPANEPILNEFLGGLGAKLGKGSDQKLFDTAINAVKSIVKAHGPAGYTARVGGAGGQKMQLTTWLGSIVKNLMKIKEKMPEVQAKHAERGKAKQASWPDPEAVASSWTDDDDGYQYPGRVE